MLAELKKRYPNFSIKSEPAEGCTVCKGKGEKYTKLVDKKMPCLCTCLSGEEEDRIMVTTNIAKWAMKEKAKL